MRRNLGFKIKPGMTEGEKFYEYARALETEAWKYRHRTDRKNGESAEQWWNRVQPSARRYVEQVARMIEAMEA